MARKILRNKYFWIALTITIPVLILWFKVSFFAAMVVLVVTSMIAIMIFTQRRRKTKRYYYYEDDDDEEEEMIIERRSRRPSSSSDRVRDLYFPKGLRNIHQDGLNSLGQRQRDDYNKTMRRLRRP